MNKKSTNSKQDSKKLVNNELLILRTILSPAANEFSSLNDQYLIQVTILVTLY